MYRKKYISNKWNALGVNYGSDVVYGPTADMTTARNDLRIISRHMNRIRFHIPSANVSPHVVANSMQVIEIAKSYGLKVVWGCTSNGTTLTAANWQAYHDATIQRAMYAESIGVDEFNVANEDEYRIDGTTLPIATFRQNISSLALDVKAVFSGIVSYAVSHNHTFGWITFGLGNLDKIGLNIYGSSPYDHRFFIYIISTFYRAFGDNMYISEFNIADSWPSFTEGEASQKHMLRDRIVYIRQLGVKEAYFFTYCHASDDEFALRLADGSFRQMWGLFIEGRPTVNRR